MWNVPPVIDSDVIDAVTGQLRTSGLPPTMRTLLQAKSPASPPPPPGGGIGGCTTGAALVENANTVDHGPVVVESAARTRPVETTEAAWKADLALLQREHKQLRAAVESFPASRLARPSSQLLPAAANRAAKRSPYASSISGSTPVAST